MIDLKGKENAFPIAFSKKYENMGDMFAPIEVPRCANLLYLESIDNSLERNLLEKYVNDESFTDDDYKNLFKLFMTVAKELPTSGTGVNLFAPYGIRVKFENGECKPVLIEEYILQIKINTWECIAIDLLKPLYTDIINCFDFGNINIDLSEWKTDNDIQKQSLLNAFRSAFIFTILGYLYGDDNDLYDSFENFFDKEFYKRIALINGIWKHRKDGELIEYIPIFDSFYNLDGMTSDKLRKMLGLILDDDEIAIDERKFIQYRLIEGAKEFRNNNTLRQKSLEHDLVKPVVNFLIELQTAKDVLSVARELNTGEEEFFGTIINRCYYSMMHTTKALLEYKNKLSDWEVNELNTEETHKSLMKKLKDISRNGTIDNSYVAELDYVKKKRWLADYSLSIFSKAECDKCIDYAEKFLNEVKRITA